MCGVDFSVTTGYSKMPIWDLPTAAKGQDPILESLGSIYNAKILQPLCNTRNLVMSSTYSPCAKRTISYLCAAAMVLGGLVVDTAEVATRLALAIITSPLLLALFCAPADDDDDSLGMIPLGLLLTAAYSGIAIWKGVKAAAECFTKNGNIESLRAKSS